MVGEVSHCHRSHDFTVRRDVTSYAWSPFLFLPMTGVEAWCGLLSPTKLTVHLTQPQPRVVQSLYQFFACQVRLAMR